jgi:hypothetical protein
VSLSEIPQSLIRDQGSRERSGRDPENGDGDKNFQKGESAMGLPHPPNLSPETSACVTARTQRSAKQRQERQRAGRESSGPPP